MIFFLQQMEATSTDKRVEQMFQIAFNNTEKPEKRLTAMNNLLVLARENAGAVAIWKRDGVQKLMEVIQKTKGDDTEMRLATQRVLDELARDEKRVFYLFYFFMSFVKFQFTVAGHQLC